MIRTALFALLAQHEEHGAAAADQVGSSSVRFDTWCATAVRADFIPLKKEPNSFRGTYGAARAAEAAGDRGKAKTYYNQLLHIARDADTARPELVAARNFK